MQMFCVLSGLVNQVGKLLSLILALESLSEVEYCSFLLLLLNPLFSRSTLCISYPQSTVFVGSQ